MDTRQWRRAFASLGTVTLAVSPLSPATPAPAPITITAEHAVTTVAEGGAVRVGVTLTTADGRPTTTPTRVPYETAADTAATPGTATPAADAAGTPGTATPRTAAPAAGTAATPSAGTATPGTATPGAAIATPGLDYAPVSGTLTFPPGTPSGETRSFTLTTYRDHTPETAETIPLRLDNTHATVVVNANGLPYLDHKKPVDKRVQDLLARMTLAEKVGQMTQAERGAVTGDPAVIARQRLGSVLSGGGSTPATNTPAAWVAMVNEFQAQAMTTRLQIPLVYGIDAVHGHGNVFGATIFPHNVGLGATRDPRLVEEIGRATAAEVRATGIPWSFSPCVCVTRDERWGRAYESFGEDPALVASMETIIDGLQGRLGDPERVLATAKHYVGDGNTEFDAATAAANIGKPWYEQRYTIDQGITVTNREDFARYDFAPYPAAIRRHHVGSVMPSFSSVDWVEDGVGNPTKVHASHELITTLLKQGTGFDGFVVSDWEGIHQIPDPADPSNGGLTPYKVRVGVNAGTDMFMEPFSAGQFEELLLAEVATGRVSMARIDDAVTRILRQKFRLGLFERPFAPADRVDEVGSPEHRALARRAVAQSQVLLKNEGVLPLAPRGSIYVAGRNADDIGNQAGGWTIQWQGVSGDIVPGTTILEGIREVAPQATVTFSPDASAPMAGADVGIVVVGETPYSEGYGDIGGPECGFCSPAQFEAKSLALQPADRAVVDKVCGAIRCVVLVVSGRPQVLTDQLGQMDALVASWLPGTEGAGVADVLFGRRPFTGRLSVTWPRSEAQVPINVGDADYRPLFPYGWGLRTAKKSLPAPSTSGVIHES